MLQAASSGALDFRRADPRSRAWQRRLNIALYSIEKANVARWSEVEAAHAHAMLSRVDLTDDGYEHYQAASARHRQSVRRRLFPWFVEKVVDRGDAAKALERQWIAVWGDPKDPAVAARIEATAQALAAGDRSRR